MCTINIEIGGAWYRTLRFIKYADFIKMLEYGLLFEKRKSTLIMLTVSIAGYKRRILKIPVH